MAKKPKIFHLCIVERTKLVKRGTLNVVKGSFSFTREEIVDEACGTPLFSDRERQTGICQSCRDGWSVEGNTPTERGLKQIAEVQS